MSWERCPSCGGPAAAGWQASTGPDGLLVGEDLVEFDCSSGCSLLLREVTETFRASGRMP
ncbi:hypothetical protein D0Z06_20295 [Geodermatophilus marinus]|nr:hypothetical protein D0Z06_20295 [Geodermatophilus sp. LHW52908]